MFRLPKIYFKIPDLWEFQPFDNCILFYKSWFTSIEQIVGWIKVILIFHMNLLCFMVLIR